MLYGLSLTSPCQRLLAASSIGNARLANAILDGIGENTRVSDATIWSPKYAVTVLPACSAIEFLLFFAATVLAFPARFSRKVMGLLVGVPALLALNQIRILSLYYIGAHYPRFFDAVHENGWGILLIVAEIGLCLTWMEWAREKERVEPDAAA
jgi:exosortase/archaeosortase family protein